MKQKLRERKPNRWSDFDYTKNAYYFVTFCTHGRINYFGGIRNNIMCINRLGSIICQQWAWLQIQYPYIQSHAFIVMPNHVHAIIEINSDLINQPRRVTSRPVPTIQPVPTATQPTSKIKSLSELIGAFKTTSSKLIHQSGFTQFQWQRSFYDHIIRNEKSFKQIRRYIINNPKIWNRDRNNIKKPG